MRMRIRMRTMRGERRERMRTGEQFGREDGGWNMDE
jgi:hypothetical protein